MVKGIVTTLPSEAFVQVMLGAGFPSAVQFRVTVAPTFNVWLPEMSVITGGSTFVGRENNEN